MVRHQVNRRVVLEGTSQSQSEGVVYASLYCGLVVHVADRVAARGH